MKVKAILCEIGSQGYMSRDSQHSTTESPPTIFIEVTPNYHDMDPDYCLMSEKWNPVRKNPQQKLVFRIYVGCPGPRGSLRREVCGGPIYDTV